ncbi:MAG: mercuric reductase [Gemmatimonadota bacterium]
MRHDVIIIGSGQAGVPLADALIGDGRRVLLAERSHLGGTCVNTGCTPTKTMIASARAAHVARNAGRLGVRTGPVSVDLAAVVDRKESFVAQWRAGVEKRLDRLPDDFRLVLGHARLLGPNLVEVAGERFEADTVVINVGARARRLTVPGADTVPLLTNAGLMDLREAPRRLICVGGGYIGCELGQAFHRFGSEVVINNRADRLLAREDPDVSEALGQALEAEGIELALGAQVACCEPVGDDVRLELIDGRVLEGSHALIAIGRMPNTDDLGCEAAGVDLREDGTIVVDDLYRTSAQGVYAVGDCAGGPQFTHTAWDDYRILHGILRGEPRRTRSDRVIPAAVFTDPQVARIGPTETEARAAGLRFELATMPFAHVARALETDETAGLLKVMIDPDTERIIGAAIVGAEAAELIHPFVALVAAGAPASAIVDAEAVHPAYAEGLQSVLRKLDRYE